MTWNRAIYQFICVRSKVATSRHANMHEGFTVKRRPSFLIIPLLLNCFSGVVYKTQKSPDSHASVHVHLRIETYLNKFQDK